jgi:hypothetical protein
LINLLPAKVLFDPPDECALHDRRFSLLRSKPSRSFLAEVDAGEFLPVRIENDGYPVLMFPASIFAESRFDSFLDGRGFGLELEMTESALMEDAESTLVVLGALKAMGVQLAIDDFGTVYSSFTYLRRFPVDSLKLDQSFVQEISADPGDADIVSAMIDIGNTAKLRVIAEGVETRPQLMFLRRHGCTEGQGYYLGRPQPAAKLLEAGVLQQMHGPSLQPVSPWLRFLPMMMHASHKEGTDRSLRQARRIDRNTGAPPSLSARATQPAYRLADRPVDGYVVQALQKAIQSGEVGHAPQPQRLAQFAMLAQPHFGFAKGPVFVTHQAENGQQLRLVELVLAEAASVTREHRLRDLQGDASKRQQSDFGHCASCPSSKQQFQRTGHPEFSSS